MLHWPVLLKEAVCNESPYYLRMRYRYRLPYRRNCYLSNKSNKTINNNSYYLFSQLIVNTVRSYSTESVVSTETSLPRQQKQQLQNMSTVLNESATYKQLGKAQNNGNTTNNTKWHSLHNLKQIANSVEHMSRRRQRILQKDMEYMLPSEKQINEKLSLHNMHLSHSESTESKIASLREVQENAAMHFATGMCSSNTSTPCTLSSSTATNNMKGESDCIDDKCTTMNRSSTEMTSHLQIVHKQLCKCKVRIKLMQTILTANSHALCNVEDENEDNVNNSNSFSYLTLDELMSLIKWAALCLREVYEQIKCIIEIQQRANKKTKINDKRSLYNFNKVHTGKVTQKDKSFIDGLSIVEIKQMDDILHISTHLTEMVVKLITVHALQIIRVTELFTFYGTYSDKANMKQRYANNLKSYTKNVNTLVAQLLENYYASTQCILESCAKYNWSSKNKENCKFAHIVSLAQSLRCRSTFINWVILSQNENAENAIKLAVKLTTRNREIDEMISVEECHNEESEELEKEQKEYLLRLVRVMQESFIIVNQNEWELLQQQLSKTSVYALLMVMVNKITKGEHFAIKTKTKLELKDEEEEEKIYELCNMSKCIKTIDVKQEKSNKEEHTNKTNENNRKSLQKNEFVNWSEMLQNWVKLRSSTNSMSRVKAIKQLLNRATLHFDQVTLTAELFVKLMESYHHEAKNDNNNNNNKFNSTTLKAKISQYTPAKVWSCTAKERLPVRCNLTLLAFKSHLQFYAQREEQLCTKSNEHEVGEFCKLIDETKMLKTSNDWLKWEMHNTTNNNVLVNLSLEDLYVVTRVWRILEIERRRKWRNYLTVINTVENSTQPLSQLLHFIECNMVNKESDGIKKINMLEHMCKLYLMHCAPEKKEHYQSANNKYVSYNKTMKANVQYVNATQTMSLCQPVLFSYISDDLLALMELFHYKDLKNKVVQQAALCAIIHLNECCSTYCNSSSSFSSSDMNHNETKNSLQYKPLLKSAVQQRSLRLAKALLRTIGNNMQLDGEEVVMQHKSLMQLFLEVAPLVDPFTVASLIHHNYANIMTFLDGTLLKDIGRLCDYHEVSHFLYTLCQIVPCHSSCHIKLINALLLTLEKMEITLIANTTNTTHSNTPMETLESDNCSQSISESNIITNTNKLKEYCLEQAQQIQQLNKCLQNYDKRRNGYGGAKMDSSNNVEYMITHILSESSWQNALELYCSVNKHINYRTQLTTAPHVLLLFLVAHLTNTKRRPHMPTELFEQLCRNALFCYHRYDNNYISDSVGCSNNKRELKKNVTKEMSHHASQNEECEIRSNESTQHISVAFIHVMYMLLQEINCSELTNMINKLLSEQQTVINRSHYSQTTYNYYVNKIIELKECNVTGIKFTTIADEKSNNKMTSIESETNNIRSNTKHKESDKDTAAIDCDNDKVEMTHFIASITQCANHKEWEEACNLFHTFVHNKQVVIVNDLTKEPSSGNYNSDTNEKYKVVKNRLLQKTDNNSNTEFLIFTPELHFLCHLLRYALLSSRFETNWTKALELFPLHKLPAQSTLHAELIAQRIHCMRKVSLLYGEEEEEEEEEEEQNRESRLLSGQLAKVDSTIQKESIDVKDSNSALHDNKTEHAQLTIGEWVGRYGSNIIKRNANNISRKRYSQSEGESENSNSNSNSSTVNITFSEVHRTLALLVQQLVYEDNNDAFLFLQDGTSNISKNNNVNIKSIGNLEMMQTLFTALQHDLCITPKMESLQAAELANNESNVESDNKCKKKQYRLTRYDVAMACFDYICQRTRPDLATTLAMVHCCKHTLQTNRILHLFTQHMLANATPNYDIVQCTLQTLIQAQCTTQASAILHQLVESLLHARHIKNKEKMNSAMSVYAEEPSSSLMLHLILCCYRDLHMLTEVIEAFYNAVICGIKPIQFTLSLILEITEHELDERNKSVQAKLSSSSSSCSETYSANTKTQIYEEGIKTMLVHDMASTWDDMFVYSGKYADHALSMYRQWTSQSSSNGRTGVNIFTILYDQGACSNSSSRNTKATNESNTIHYPMKHEVLNANTYNDNINNVSKLINTHCTPILSHALATQSVKSHTIEYCSCDIHYMISSDNDSNVNNTPQINYYIEDLVKYEH